MAEQRAKSPEEKLNDLVDIMGAMRGRPPGTGVKPGGKAGAPAPAPRPAPRPAPPPPPPPPPPPSAGPKPANGSGGGYSVGGGGKEDCGIKPYKDLTCPKGQQAHHIVPDYSLRYGARKDGTKRIPGMPSLDDGPSICLSGGSKSPGTDHNKAHDGTDPRVAREGQKTTNGPIGTAPIGDTINISIEEVSKIKPTCADEIKQKVDEAFKGVNKNTYGRTTQQPPKSGTDAHGTLSRGERHMPRRGRK